MGGSGEYVSHLLQSDDVLDGMIEGHKENTEEGVTVRNRKGSKIMMLILKNLLLEVSFSPKENHLPTFDVPGLC